MAVFFGIATLLCLSSMRLCLSKDGNTEYLSLPHTQTVKGIFIILVFFNHFHSYTTYTSAFDLAFQNVIIWFGQAMVAMFLFYSGYGVMESIRKKGQGYVDGMPKKRILSTLFRFDCAVLLYALLKLWRGESITPGQFLLSLVGWVSLGNSNWYIFVILMLYLITYGAFKLCRQHNHGVLAVFLGTCAGMLCMAVFGKKQIWWYDTALCYVLGMLYSMCRKRIEEIMLGRNLVYILTLLLAFGMCQVLVDYCYTPAGGILRNLVFAVLVVALTMRVSVQSKVLKWCGIHLFPLYILQRIPMILLKELGVANFSIPLYFLLSAAGTVLLTFPFEFLTDALWEKLQKKSKT